MYLKTGCIVSTVLALVACGGSKSRLCDELLDKQNRMLETGMAIAKQHLGKQKVANYKEKTGNNRTALKNRCMQQSEEQIRQAMKVVEILQDKLDRR